MSKIVAFLKLFK